MPKVVKLDNAIHNIIILHTDTVKIKLHVKD